MRNESTNERHPWQTVPVLVEWDTRRWIGRNRWLSASIGTAAVGIAICASTTFLSAHLLVTGIAGESGNSFPVMSSGMLDGFRAGYCLVGVALALGLASLVQLRHVQY